MLISPSGESPSGALAYNIHLGTFDILGDLDASLALAENDSMAKILSAPRLTTMNNEPANITQGRNIFIQQQTQGTAGLTTSYTQVKVNLSLDVTPQVTTDGDILMNLTIARDFLGTAPVNSAAPAPIETRSVKRRG